MHNFTIEFKYNPSKSLTDEDIEYDWQVTSNGRYGFTNDWHKLPEYITYDELNLDSYSIRVNRDRQYHTKEGKGFRDEFNKIQGWRRLTTQDSDVNAVLIDF